MILINLLRKMEQNAREKLDEYFEKQEYEYKFILIHHDKCIVLTICDGNTKNSKVFELHKIYRNDDGEIILNTITCFPCSINKNNSIAEGIVNILYDFDVNKF